MAVILRYLRCQAHQSICQKNLKSSKLLQIPLQNLSALQQASTPIQICVLQDWLTYPGPW